MRSVLIAAMVVAIVAPTIRASRFGVPYALIPTAMHVRAVVSAFVGTLVLGGLAVLLARVIVSDEELADHVAGASATALGTGLVLLSASRHRFERGAALLATLLRGRESAEARDALTTLVARARHLPPARRARIVLGVTPSLTLAGFVGDVRAMLEGLPAEPLPPTLRTVRAQALAACCLDLGALEAAEEAIAAIDVDEADEPWLRATRALLHAVQGGAESALALVGEEDGPETDDALRATHAVVRAHALASMGREAEADTCLREAARIAGPSAIVRALRPVGPATDLARALAADRLDERLRV